ncbi:MAG: winged helix-turn-helix transcriptional regulator [Kiritimatiellae bacterium]|nr:winged helix-turn-helix transcriptional regulator [Kiritimatiellia bacterium]
MSLRIPFALDRKVAAPLSAQMAEGLRAAIASGFYRDGEVLPTIHEFARLLGTSVRVPREAIAALAAEGLLKPRRRIGCIVVGRGEAVWKGRILAVMPADGEGGYHAVTLLGEMRRVFNAEGYLFDVVALPRHSNGVLNCTLLDMALRRNNDFVFSLFCPRHVMRLLERSGVPFTMKQSDSGADASAAPLGDLSPFLEQCRASCIRRAFVAGIADKPFLDPLCEIFRKEGVSVERHLVRCDRGLGSLERLERMGMEMMRERFSQPRAGWPQLVFWTDDFLTVGGLAGLADLGVSIPRDVFAVTVANKGFVPVYPRSLTRFEFDPAATGRAAAAAILARIDGAPMPPIRDSVRYIQGESFR